MTTNETNIFENAGATEREDLEIFIYEGHKDAYGVKGRHYDFAAMSLEDLYREADRIEAAIDRAVAEEARAEAEALVDFHTKAEQVIAVGAGNRINALRWMTSSETFYSHQCVEHWVWKQGILFTDVGKELVHELMELVTFEELEVA